MPIPSLDIALRWSVLAKGKGQPFVGSDFAACTRYEVSRRCDIEAWPRLVSFPVNYEWCLCGNVLEEGDGQITYNGGTLTYHLAGRYLTLETVMAQAVDRQLCVSAIDVRNRELFTCVPLKIGPTESECGKGRKFYPNPSIVLIP